MTYFKRQQLLNEIKIYKIRTTFTYFKRQIQLKIMTSIISVRILTDWLLFLTNLFYFFFLTHCARETGLHRDPDVWSYEFPMCPGRSDNSTRRMHPGITRGLSSILFSTFFYITPLSLPSRIYLYNLCLFPNTRGIDFKFSI